MTEISDPTGVVSPPPAPSHRARWTDHVLLILVLAAELAVILAFRGVISPDWLRPIDFVVSYGIFIVLGIIVVKTILRVDISFGLSLGRWVLLLVLSWFVTSQGLRLVFALPGLIEPMGLRRMVFYGLGLGMGAGFVILVTYVALAVYLVWPLGPRRRPVSPTN